jgi:CHAD domain-containing protein
MTLHAPIHLVPITFEPAVAPKSPVDVRIGNDEALSDALRRITLSHLDLMIRELSHPDDADEGVHEARKAMKRVRALLRLVRDEIGYDAYRNENVVLRDVARRLAPVRDSAILVESLDDLIAGYDDLVASSVFGQTRAFLILNHRRLQTEIIDDRQLMADILVTLKAARSRFEGHGALDPTRGSAPIRNSFVAIEGGLARVHGRGRTGMRRARTLGTVEAFHEWRKRVKYLRYQIESLTPLWPDMLDAYAARLDELGEILGDDHDLAVLRSTISEHTDACTDPRVRTLLVSLIDDARADLQTRALRLGTTIFDEHTDRFTDRIASSWTCARN